jgi:NTP pyrophosphatase (non-canonical NTP hydrolase)
MEINKYVEMIHKNAVEKEFWADDMKLIEAMGDTKEIKNLIISNKLMLMVSELGEALEALRHNRLVTHYPEPMTETTLESKESFQKYYKDTFEDEIADVIIRAFDLCGYLNIPIEWHIFNKHWYNTARPPKHGKEF